MRQRIERVQNAMAAHGVHTLLVFGPKNVGYLTGFHTMARPVWQIGQTCCILSLDGSWRLFLPAPWEQDFNPPPGCEPEAYTGGPDDLARRIADRIPTDTRHRTAADLDFICVPLYRALCRWSPLGELTDAGPILSRCRMIKSPEEIFLLKQAVRMIDTGLEAAAGAVTSGAAEREVQARIDAAMLEAGSEGGGFTTKVISGSNGSYPHHVAGHTRIMSGSATIVDLSASASGYESDSARTFLLPSCPSEIRSIHKGITEILEEAGERMIPGTPVRELDRFLRGRLSKLNPNAAQAGTIGHGVGLHAHEYPDITEGSRELLAENMVLAVEPALYLPGRYGIRIENMFHICPEGGRVMNRFPLNRY